MTRMITAFSDQDAQQAGDEHRAGAVDRPAEHVPAELVGAEPVRRAGRLEDVGTAVDRAGVGDQARRGQQDDDDDGEQRGQRPAHRLPGPGPPPAAAPSGDDRGVGGHRGDSHDQVSLRMI
jgi:hypothetical protein